MHKHKGFTIIELLVVIVIIGILAAISIVAYNGIQNAARDSATKQDLASLDKKLQLYYIRNSKIPETIEEMEADGFPATNKMRLQREETPRGSYWIRSMFNYSWGSYLSLLYYSYADKLWIEKSWDFSSSGESSTWSGPQCDGATACWIEEL